MELQQLVDTYLVAPEVAALVKDTKIVLLVGPTAAGKDSIKHILLKGENYYHIISHTTRPPRANGGELEQDGVDYHFISTQAAKLMLKQHQFIEAKIYSTNIYGTSVDEIRRAHMEGKIAVTDLEVQGVAEYKAISPTVLAVFVVPPNFDIWQARLKRRYGNVIDMVDYRRRMEAAADELSQLQSTNYYVPVVNDEREKAAVLIDYLANGGALSDAQKNHAKQVVAKLQAEIHKYLRRG